MTKLCAVASLVTIATVSSAYAGEPFQKNLDLQGISFEIEATNDGSINQLTITPMGLSEDTAAVQTEIDGTVTGAEIDDLDANGYPEIYVYVTSAGSGSFGTIVAYAVNDGKTMTPIYLPPLEEDATNSKGYMGHDEFAVLEGVLGRRFPLYQSGDSNSDPTGKIRQLQYKLKAGEAGWLLELDSATDF